MRSFLFTHVFQRIGWIMYVLCLILGAILYFCAYIYSGVEAWFFSTMVIWGICAGAMFIIGAKEREENEITKSIRLASLLKSIYMFVALLVIPILYLSGGCLMNFIALSLVMFPVIFVINFKRAIYRYNKMCEEENQYPYID